MQKGLKFKRYKYQFFQRVTAKDKVTIHFAVTFFQDLKMANLQSQHSMYQEMLINIT